MAAQAALIADTIVGMKRALRREEQREIGPDDPITQPTNRGNKLRENAGFVREGALGYVNPEEFYKQKIEHAGYTRHILQRNPIRYDSEGDEIEDEDEDSEIDTTMAEENPFSEIALEHLLCPLKHPSELPVHPSMSHPYTSKALWHMTQAVEAKLRQERTLLWRARNLHRQFIGDSNWIPCGAVEGPDDRWIFDRKPPARDSAMNSDAHQTPEVQQDGAQEMDSDENVSKEPPTVQEQAAQAAGNGVEMTTAQGNGTETKGGDNSEELEKPKPEAEEPQVGEIPPHSGPDSSTDINGNDPSRHYPEGAKPANDVNGFQKLEATGNTQGSDTNEGEGEQDTEMQDASSPEPPRRMTTRAQANAQQDDGTINDSFYGDPFTLPTPHPLFLVPDAVRADANYGLPPNEAEETRRLLWSYVQKQEETVRGFEHMLDSLLRACRMKDDVFEWCKAEGHVGEMSDGEDWYDREKWGLAEGEELKKGADEDEVEAVDDTRTTGKKGRGRRA